MTDAEWAEVRAAMPVPAWLLKRGGRPEAYCHREMLDAVRYLVDNGVKRTALPVDFPYWRAVYELGTFRYVAERTIVRLHGFRRLRIRWERRDDIHEAFLGLAVCLITHRHVQRLC